MGRQQPASTLRGRWGVLRPWCTQQISDDRLVGALLSWGDVHHFMGPGEGVTPSTWCPMSSGPHFPETILAHPCVPTISTLPHKYKGCALPTPPTTYPHFLPPTVHSSPIPHDPSPYCHHVWEHVCHLSALLGGWSLTDGVVSGSTHPRARLILLPQNGGVP